MVSFPERSPAKTISFRDGVVRLSGGQIMRQPDSDPAQSTCSVVDIHLDRAALVIDEGVTPAEAIDLLRTMLNEMKDSFEKSGANSLDRS